MKTSTIVTAAVFFATLTSSCAPSVPAAPPTQTLTIAIEQMVDVFFYLGMDVFCNRAPKYPGVIGSELMFLELECKDMVSQAKNDDIRKSILISGTPEDVFYQGMQTFCERTPSEPKPNAAPMYSKTECNDMIQQARDILLFQSAVATLPVMTPSGPQG